jgi:hypothetical protein
MNPAPKKAAPRKAAVNKRAEAQRGVPKVRQVEAATAQRVMILEALDRNDGVLKSKYGVQSRLISIHGELAASPNLRRVLDHMESLGMIAQERIEGAGGKSKVVEMVLMDIPENFHAPISKLRLEKGIRTPHNGEVEDAPDTVPLLGGPPTERPPIPEPPTAVLAKEEPVVDLPAHVLDEVLADQQHLRGRIKELEDQLQEANVTIRALSRALASTG